MRSFVCAWLLSMLFAAQAASSVAAVDYVRDVKPILSKNCYNCHGPLRQKSGLRLDHLTFIRQGGDSGPAIGGKSDDSLLVHAVSGTGGMERMPLEAKPLSDEQIATLKAWIDEGAQAPEEKLPDDPRKYWSFRKPARPALPSVQNPAWAAHPIDRFLAAEHEARGLTPTAPAPKNVLLRRVYLDLIGLPPTTVELRAFLADPSEDSYERVVDKLLASPQYGERWGRHWMDVWRYSDWDGYGAEVRESKPHIWRWRDWIIESLNADRPYDQMIREMLAADEIAPGDPSALRANGFLVRNWYRFNRNVWLDGTVEHTSKAFLGITLNCARCHDHMYDPILQTEYYQFRALFEPHDVRTDRVPGQSDTVRDGLVRVYDAEADKPTYLFVRGNEAKPDKEHPLPPGVPGALGGGELKFEPVPLPPTAYYPGLQSFVQQESLAQAQAEVDRAESALAKTNTVLAEARKKLADFTAAKPAPPAAAETATQPTAVGSDEKPAEKAAGEEENPAASEEKKLNAAVAEAQSAAALAEQEMLTTSAGLVSVRAKIAADNVAFARPPAGNAKELARDASRAERVYNLHQTRQNVMRLEQDLAKARVGADDKAAKKKVADTEPKLADALKARDAAQAAFGQPGETYTHLGQVYPSTSTGRRAALARWIASKDNPLTARVAINHIWLRHFGSPLVPTVFDFGLNGKPPTHPTLLDWLAVELMEQGWQMKAIHRLLVTSAAYRMQSAAADETNRTRDPDNVFLWRMNPRRMEAEVVRDSTLRVADGLDPTMFGPELDQNTGMSVPRRSIYFRNSKEKKVAFLAMFDSPNVTDCYRRGETVVPQQALAMVNSSLTLAQARRLAAALVRELGTQSNSESLSRFVAAAFERILCRAPSGEERGTCLEFLEQQSRRLADPKALIAFTAGGDNPVKPAADPAQRARENLIHVLLNHNDFLMVR
ncbi:MAG: DUF1553 domain-containing protein [Planctomycetia bacterium]|nr:DUF1553 domain-containing protein [Planctomycetia bacterium]